MEVPSIFLNRILANVAKKGASSLHLSVGSAPVIRLQARLVEIEKESIVTQDLLNKIINSFLDKEELELFGQKKEIVVVKKFGGDFRFRVNIFYQKNLPSLSFSYIPNEIRSLEDLNLSGPVNKIFKYKSGLFIIAGPNDSGKTSTIASIIEKINEEEKKYIITIENPIEYTFVNKKSIIEQRQVGQDVESFAEGLEHCLTEDVDLVYVDDLRVEYESAIPLILELAAGNSLVIVEMNAENSVRVIEKILNASNKRVSELAARFSLGDVLVGIISQKLIPNQSQGLSLAVEILIANSAVKSLIREGKIYQLASVIQTSREEGMISMEKSIEELVKSGEIKMEEVGKLKLYS